MAKIKLTMKPGPDGKPVKVYVLRYLDRNKLSASGKPTHRQESFSRSKDASARLLVIQNELAAGTHIAKGAKITVSQLFDLFYKSAENRVADGRMSRTKFAQIRAAVNGMEPMVGPMKLVDIRQPNIEDLYTRLVRESKLKPYVAKARVRYLSEIFEFAVKRELVGDNVVHKALGELRGVKPDDVRTFTVEEAMRLFESMEMRAWRTTAQSHLKAKVFVCLAAFCGLRWGEIAGLKRENIDLDRRIIMVRHTWTRWGVLHPPKTAAGRRDVPIPHVVTALLREWLDRFHLANELDLVFVRSNTRKGIQSSNFYYEQWVPTLKKAGLLDSGDQLHFHALRHFAASRWIGAGMPLPDVAKLMGHSKVNMTLKIYAHALTSTSYQDRLLDEVTTGMMLPRRPLEIAA